MSPNFLCGHDPTRFVQVVGDNRNAFTCGACRTAIVGKRLSCTFCGFNVHSFCKRCPPTLSSSLHPRHPLVLTGAGAGSGSIPYCNVCNERIRGIYYTCRNRRQCNFNVHPQCSQLRPQLWHVLDRRHALQLQYKAPNTTRCDVCRRDCGGWGYRCGVCSVDVHYWCFWRPVATAQPVAVARRLRPQPQQPFYFGYCNNYYNGYGIAAPYYGWTGNNINNVNNGVRAGGSGSGSRSGVGSVMGSLAVNVLTGLVGNLILGGFGFC